MSTHHAMPLRSLPLAIPIALVLWTGLFAGFAAICDLPQMPWSER